MIYLIDDDKYQQQQQNYNAEYLINGTFSNSLELITTIPNDNFVPTYTDEDVILIHNSFDNVNAKNEIVYYAKANDIPYCIFSNQFANGAKISDSGDEISFIEEIKKDLFYRNLKDFLEEYHNNGEINLFLLIHGKNYKFAKALEIRNQLFLQLFTTETNYNSYGNDRELLIKLYHLSNQSTGEIEEQFEEITIQEFKKTINKLIAIIKNEQ